MRSQNTRRGKPAGPNTDPRLQRWPCWARRRIKSMQSSLAIVVSHRLSVDRTHIAAC